MDSQNSNMYAWKRKSFLFAPLIFLAHLFFFTRCKIIFDIKCFSDFLWGFTFDHIGYCLARYIQQSLKWNIFFISNKNFVCQQHCQYIFNDSITRLPLYLNNLLPKWVQTMFLDLLWGNLSPTRKCRLFVFPCSHHPLGVVDHPCDMLPIEVPEKIMIMSKSTTQATIQKYVEIRLLFKTMMLLPFSK